MILLSACGWNSIQCFLFIFLSLLSLRLIFWISQWLSIKIVCRSLSLPSLKLHFRFNRLAHFKYLISMTFSFLPIPENTKRSLFSGHIWSWFSNSRKSHFNISIHITITSVVVALTITNQTTWLVEPSKQPPRSNDSIWICAYHFGKCISGKLSHESIRNDKIC